MSSLTTVVVLLAAFLTTLANVPQVLKAWRTRETQDLSLVMVLTLASGLALWVVYGVMKGDAVLIGANGVALAIALVLAALKLRHG